MKYEHKCVPFEVKAVTDPGGDGGSGSFEGIGGAFHNIDSALDIIAPGAFDGGLAKFLSDGFIGGLNHNWDAPIGHPIEAKESAGAGGLHFKAVFDETPDAQSVRAKMKTNPASGRATIRKLSIGYGVLDSEKLSTPDAVRAYWKSNGYEPSPEDSTRLAVAFKARKDPKTGKESTPGVRLLKKLNLYEVSPVAMPANDRANVVGAKYMGDSYYGGYGSPDLDDPGALLGDTDRVVAYVAMSRLHDLLCMALYGILGNDMVPIGDRLMLVGQACDQFKASLVEILTYFLADDPSESEGGAGMQDAVETMARQFKARFDVGHDPAEFAAKLGAASAPGFADQSRSVVSAVEGFVERAEARVDARLKDGRELSSSNRSSLGEVRDGLRAHAETIDAMLARTEKPAKSPATSEANQSKGKEPDPVAGAGGIVPINVEAEGGPSPAAQPGGDAPGEGDVSEPKSASTEDGPPSRKVDPATVKNLFTRFIDTKRADLTAPSRN